MVTRIIELKRPKVKNPLFIEGLPGIGHVGRIAADYLIEQLGAQKFAEMYSSHFMPSVLLHETSAVHLLRNEFYSWKAQKKGQRDLFILIGDSQSIDPEGHYEIVERILNYLSGFGVKDIITLGGLSVGKLKKPRVVGVVSDPALVKKYRGYGIDFDMGARVGTVVGATGLLLGLARYYEMRGICLLGETVGFPVIPDPRSARAILEVLIKILNIDIDLTKLERKVREMERFINRLEEIRKKTAAQLFRPRARPEKELRYIG